jgi:hypothetical protein
MPARKTIDADLPDETRCLKNFDQLRAGIENMIDMPARTRDNLFGFLRRNGGQLSKCAQENEFAEPKAQENNRVVKTARMPRRCCRRGQAL